jgi:hypothetical protein
MERELASEADPKGRREYELSIKLADNVLENYPAISKELKKIRDTGDRMPDEFFDHDTVDGAKQNLATIQAAMTPSARKIGAILSPSKEIRDNEIINDDDELLPSEKADAARDHYWDTVAKLR